MRYFLLSERMEEKMRTTVKVNAPLMHLLLAFISVIPKAMLTSDEKANIQVAKDVFMANPDTAEFSLPDHVYFTLVKLATLPFTNGVQMGYTNRPVPELIYAAGLECGVFTN